MSLQTLADADLTLAAIVWEYRTNPNCSDETFQAMVREWAEECYTPGRMLEGWHYQRPVLPLNGNGADPGGPTYSKADPPALVCGHCDGAGTVSLFPWGRKACPFCNGTGRVE